MIASFRKYEKTFPIKIEFPGESRLLSFSEGVELRDSLNKAIELAKKLIASQTSR